MGDVLNHTIEPHIDGVKIIPLKQFEDERGGVLHMMRSDSPHFSRFGEIYFSIVNPHVIKGWKYHIKMTQFFAVPVGRIRLVMFDDRGDSPSNGEVEEVILGRPDRYFLVRIPPMLWYGFKGVSKIPALVANCADLPHDRSETEQRSIDDIYIPYHW